MFNILNILNFFKKNFNKKDFLIIFLIFFLYFFTRLVNLEKFPIFTDEGIYINWAKTAWHDASMRFISLTDGKQPLQTWATIPFLKLFPNKPLFAGRLFSVFTGFFSLFFVFGLLFFLFDKKTAFLGSFFYIFTPYFLFYDRMALTDSAVNMGFLGILFFSLLLIKYIRLDVALIFGLFSGLALLTKSSTQLFVFLGLLAPISIWKIINFCHSRESGNLYGIPNKSEIVKNKNSNKKDFWLKILNFYILYSLVIVIAFLIYNIQRLSPYMHYIGIKNTTFLMTKEEFLKAPFSLFWNNVFGVLVDIVWEAGFVLPIFAFFGLFFLFKRQTPLTFYLFLWFLIPFLIIASISKVIFPRYLIFFASLMVVFASFFLNQINKKVKIFLLTIFLISAFYFDHKILFDFKNISFPEVDRGQYIEGPPAGWGVKEIIDFSIKKSKEKPVILMAEGNFGLVGDMLRASLPRNGHQVSVDAYWPLEEKHLISRQKDLDKYYIYVVFPHRSDFPQNWPIKLIKKFEKPGKKSAIYFFELRKK
jgi:4-amino-4-deoxy-L-arabinose transferase-like glycosyltransferase